MTSDQAPSARRLALDALDRIEQTGAFVGLSTSGVPSDPREERLATEFEAGVTRQRRYLDFLLSHFYRGDLDAMEPRLRQVLRLGIYDLLFLGTPPHAAVHEAVRLARQRVRPGAAGLVNAVLRAALRQRDALPEPDTGSLARDLAVRHSHPTWLVRRWLDRFGPDETRALLVHNNTRPIYGVRVNTLQQSPEAFQESLRALELDFTPSPLLDDFVRVPRLQPIIEAGWLAEGRCAVQDEAAGLVVRVLDPQAGETVFDVCAAPGGKALYAAQQMAGAGRVVASDVHAARLGLVEKAARLHGLGSVETIVGGVEERAAQGAQADAVLLDAPCSGTGVLAKRADLRWNRTPEELTALTALQERLLNAAARMVRPGGRLVYSTCSIEREENEAQVARFQAAHPEFDVESAGPFVPATVVTPEGYYAALPHRTGTDGAFAARLRRAT